MSKVVSFRRGSLIPVLAALACSASAAFAQPTVDQLFSMRLQNSANSNNFATGDVMFWGANSVQPAATSWGITRQCPAGSDCSSGPTDPDYVRQALYYRPYTLLPNQYFASRPYDPNLTGPWTLVVSSTPTFAAGTNTVVNTPTIGGVALMPFVQDMSVQGAGLTPTVSWTLPGSLPSGLSIDQVHVRVFGITDTVTTTSRSPALTNSFQQGDFLYDSGPLAPSTTSFTLPSGLLELGKQYSIAIAVDHLRSPGSVDSRSQSFFDFTPISLPGDPQVYLPTTVPVPTTSGLTAGPLYSFNIGSVSPGQVTFIDPLVATGFEYRIGQGDPNFKSVQVATAAGDDKYDIYIWDGSAWVPIKLDLGLNEVFDFSLNGYANGVDQFQIRGIEEDAGLNPFNVTAFVTGLTFMSEGAFTGTMQAIIAEVSVPEPGTLLLFAAALAALALARARQGARRA